MIDVKALFSLWLFIFASQTCYSFAATRSSVTLELGADDSNGQSYYVSGRYGFENGFLLKASTGESVSTDPLNGEISSESQIIAIQSDPSALFSVGLKKSSSLQVGAINIDAAIFTLEMNTLDWGVFISPVQRDISIETANNLRAISFESNGSVAGITYYGWDPVYLSFNKSTYKYPSQLSVVSNRTGLFTYIFGATTVNQIFALEDERSTREIGYYFDNASVSVSQSKGRSAVDQSISTVNVMYLSYNVSNSWVLGFSVGTSIIDVSSNVTRFSSLSLGYRW